jgi:hypothetical protein
MMERAPNPLGVHALVWAGDTSKELVKRAVAETTAAGFDLFHALADIDYRGPITFESFSSSVLAPGLSHDLAVWRDLWNDGAALAVHARQFLANHLASAIPAAHA